MMRFLANGEQLGDYLIGDKLDEGGMGAVYRAFKPDSRDAYVVKILLPDLGEDPHFRKRFEREVTLLQTLQHPNIVPIYDYGEQDGLLYFVMPFIRGQSLSKVLRKQHFSPATAWLILESVTQALAYAHSQNIIHRDLKPANILLESRGGATDLLTQAYLADFGLSKAIGKTSLTQAGIAVGTPQYMSPEQVRGQPVTPRTDVYALGILTYETLLGRVPFGKGTAEAVAFQQVRSLPPRPTELNPDFPSELEAVILQALAKDPDERFESAQAFGAAYWEAIQAIPQPARMSNYWVDRTG